MDDSEGHDVRGAHDAGTPLLEQVQCSADTALVGVERLNDPQGLLGQALPHGVLVAGPLALSRDHAHRPHGQPDALVSQGNEMVHSYPGRPAVIGREARGLDGRCVAVDRHQWNAALTQTLVAGDVAGGVRVAPGDEDDPRDAPVHQHLDVLVLADTAGRLGAQQRGVPGRGQELLDLLGEQGKDRIAQLRHDQSHEAPGRLVHGLGSLVAEDVECREHLPPSRVGHVGLSVEYTRDGGGGHACLVSDVGESESLRHK